MNVAGIDVSTKTGLVILDEKGKLAEAREIELPPLPKASSASTRLMRALILKHTLTDALLKYRVHLCAVEGYAHASPFGMATAVELGTMARLAIWHCKLPFYEVSPSTLKKFATGVGKGDKSKVRLGVFKRWAFEDESDNIVDAYALARICLAAGGGAKKTAVDDEVVMTLKRALPVGPV